MEAERTAIEEKKKCDAELSRVAARQRAVEAAARALAEKWHETRPSRKKSSASKR
jgi:DNA-binding FrmR family transcriptional regulator